MNTISWKINKVLLAGTTLKNIRKPLENNLALHTGGDKETLIANRRAFCEANNITLDQCVFAKQTHSDHIHCVTKQDIGRGAYTYESAIDDCDALYTREKNCLLGVFHADCVPVLLYDPVEEIIVAIHSGWKGTVQEITAKTLQQIITKEHVKPENVYAYIGPAMNYESLEVGKEVVDLVQAMHFDTTDFITQLANGKARIDNKGLNKKMLLLAGVPEENIIVNPSDTFAPNDALFSYRREHQCGRHLSYIMMK